MPFDDAIAPINPDNKQDDPEFDLRRFRQQSRKIQQQFRNQYQESKSADGASIDKPIETTSKPGSNKI